MARKVRRYSSVNATVGSRGQGKVDPRKPGGSKYRPTTGTTSVAATLGGAEVEKTRKAANRAQRAVNERRYREIAKREGKAAALVKESFKALPKETRGEAKVRRLEARIDAERAKTLDAEENDAIAKIARTEIPGSEYANKAAAQLLGIPQQLVPKNEKQTVQDVAVNAALAAATGGSGSAAKAGTTAAGAAANAAKAAVRAKGVRAGETVAEAVAKKAPQTVAKARKVKIVATKAKTSAKASKAGRAASKVAKSKPAKPIRYASKNPGKTSLAAIEAPGVVAAAMGKDPKDALTAPLVGTAKALVRPKTYGTTAKTLPGLITAPVGIAANVGLSGYRGAANASGLKDYSSEEIAAPTKSVAKEFYDSGKHYVETYASGDADRIAKATEEEFGVGQLIPAAAGVSKITRGRVGKAGRKVPVAGPAVARKLNDRRARKAEAKEAAYADAAGEGWAAESAKPIIRNARKVKGSRGTLRNRKGIDPSDTLKVVAEEGIQTVAQAKKVRDRLGPRPDTHKGAVTAHDALDYVIDHPEILRDKNYNAALTALREASKEIENSPRAKLGPQAITHGVKLPEERRLADRAAAAAIKDKKKRAYYEEQIDKAAEADFETEMAAVRKKEGLAEPAYTHDSDVMRRNSLSSTPAFPKRGASKQHKSEFILNRKGGSDQSFDALIEGTIRKPRVRRAQHERTANFAEDAAVPIHAKGPKGEREVKYVTSAEVRKAVADGELDPNRHIVIDSGQFRQAVIDPESAKPELGYGEKSLQDFINQREGEAKGGLDISKGKKYVVVERARAEEFFAQMDPSKGNIPFLSKAQRAASRALLAYSPSWLALQPIAETAQALASVGPRHLIAGKAAVRRMSPEDRRKFREQIGASAGTGEIRDAVASLDPKSSRLTDELRPIQNSRTGRVAHGILTGRYAGEIDRRKGASIREAVAAGKLHREYKGFTSGLRGLIRTGQKLEKIPLEKRMARIANDRKLGRELEKYVDDTMGNWRALTARERQAAAFVTFYPFVRMSLSWTFHSYPKNHPVKAAIQQFLAQAQTQQIEQFYGGEPGFFQKYAAAPLYAGRGKELGEATSQLGFLGRIAPASNTLVEAAGSGDNPIGSAVRAINPYAGAIVNAVGGQDPLTGASLLDKGEKVSPELAARLFVSQIISMPAPIRTADLASGGKLKAKITDKPDTPYSQAFDILQGEDWKRALRGVIPFIPENRAKQKQMNDLGNLIERKFKQPEFGDVIAAAQQATSGKDRQAAYEAAQTLFDSLKADKHIQRLFKQLGVGQHELSDDTSALAGALTGRGGYPLEKSDILETLREQNIPVPRNARRVRRTR